MKSISAPGVTRIWKALVLGCLLFPTTMPLVAHEFWLAPSSHRVNKGEPLELNATIGQDDKVEAVKRLPRHIKQFQVYDGEGLVKVSGRNFSLPTGVFQTRRDGVHVFCYESHGRLNTLPGERFQVYLAAEGLEEILAERAAAGEQDAPGRERYTRCAKSLVQVGRGGGTDRALGLPFEIVAKADPFGMKVGSTFLVQVLREGEPMPGVLIKSFSPPDSKKPVLVRSDGDGYARIQLTRTGRWMLHAVFMDALDPDDREADWESFWASLTFEVPAN